MLIDCSLRKTLFGDKLVLTPNDTFVWKGIAILCIIIHNFSRHIPSVHHFESEYFYRVYETKRFFEMLFDGDDVFFAVFSYLGHFGVALFVFLSGYGLVKKYENGGKLKPVKFLWYNATKLYKIIVPIVLIIWIVDLAKSFCNGVGLYESLTNTFTKYWLITLKTFTFTNGLFMENGFSGPWWYLPLCMQLYICYIFINRWRSKWFLLKICLVSVLSQALCLHYHYVETLKFIRWNFLGWMMPFIMGIWAARYNWLTKNLLLAFACFVLFIICGLDKYSWIFQSAFLILTISLIKTYRIKLFEFIGSVSSYIFVTHSFIRDFYITRMPNILGCLLFVITSIIAGIIYKAILDIKVSRLNKNIKE